MPVRPDSCAAPCAGWSGPSFLQMVGISLTGSAIVEKIFSLPGLGYSIVDSVLYRTRHDPCYDFVFAFFLVICNTVSDILHGYSSAVTLRG